MTDENRRRLLRFASLFAFALAALPFLPVSGYLYVKSQIQRIRESGKWPRIKIANLHEMPPGNYRTFYYPTSDDPEYQSVLIRFPEEIAKATGKELTAYNRTCVHLRCLVNPVPQAGILGCPCHGSIYRLRDAFPIGGPAKLIGRALPVVELQIDDQGDVYAVGLVGEIGYGREK